MSCFVLSNKQICEMFSGLEIISNRFYTMKNKIENVYNVLNAINGKNLMNLTCNEFDYYMLKTLKEFNINSCKIRYKDHEIEQEDFKVEKDTEMLKGFFNSFHYFNNHFEFDKKIFLQTVNSLRCYLYQCDNQENEKLYVSLNELLKSIEEFYIDQETRKNKVEWCY